jgi:hypothetical protein
MAAFWELPKAHLLVLMAAQLEPLRRCSDGRWRSVARHFPVEGIEEVDIDEVEAEKLIEFCPLGAIVTERGRRMLDGGREDGGGVFQTGALLAEREAHRSVQ